MIFAAGRGTRLSPITDTVPKALVKVGSKTMFDHVAQKLFSAGARRLVVNVHYLGGMIVDHIRKHYAGQPVYISFETDKLLDTGGGLKKAAHLLIPGMPVVVHNVDVLSDISIHQMFRYHLQSGSTATIAVRNRPTKRYFLFDGQQRLRGWQNTETGETIIPGEFDQKLSPMAFSGIHIINQKLFDYFPEASRFSMVDMYLSVCKKEKIVGYDHTAGYWTDIGKPEQLAEAEKRVGNII